MLCVEYKVSGIPLKGQQRERRMYNSPPAARTGRLISYESSVVTQYVCKLIQVLGFMNLPNRPPNAYCYFQVQKMYKMNCILSYIACRLAKLATLDLRGD